MLIKKLLLLIFAAGIFISCSDSGSNNTPNIKLPDAELNITGFIPANGEKLAGMDVYFRVFFSEEIDKYSPSIRIFSYDDDILVEKVASVKVVEDSCLIFRAGKELIPDKKYYVLIDTGSVIFTKNDALFKGYKDKDVWTFLGPRELPEENIMTAKISGSHTGDFVSDAIFSQFSSFEENIELQGGDLQKGFMLFLSIDDESMLFEPKEYPFDTLMTRLIVYTGQSSEIVYNHNINGKFKILENNEAYIEAEFNLTASDEGSQGKSVAISNGYLLYKKYIE